MNEYKTARYRKTRMPNLSAKKKQEIGEFYLENGLTAAIQKYGYSETSILRCRDYIKAKEKGLTQDKFSYPRHFRLLLAKSWEQTRNYSATATKYGVDPGTVQRAVLEFFYEPQENDVLKAKTETPKLENVVISELNHSIDVLNATVKTLNERVADLIAAIELAVEKFFAVENRESEK